MNITKTNEGDAIVLMLEGKLSTGTAQTLTDAANPAIAQTERLVMDFAGIDYVASAGLRVLLATQKAMEAKNGKFSLRHVSADVLEVLEMTGMDGLFEIEE
jgi:anti-sigma B factor antagonist